MKIGDRVQIDWPEMKWAHGKTVVVEEVTERDPDLEVATFGFSLTWPDGKIGKFGWPQSYAVVLADEEMAWQPIDSAPRDGSAVGLYYPQAYSSRKIFIGWYEDRGWRDEYAPIYPTHWQPLPEPPKIAAAETAT